MRRRVAAALLCAATLAAAAAACHASRAEPGPLRPPGPPTGRSDERPALRPLPARPRLVLVVVVDQMRFDYLTRFEGLFQGGLRRVMAEGAVFENARFRHANTETGPGHAALISGRSGRRSGIIANEWWDSGSGILVNVVDDPAHRPLGGGTRGASPANFIGWTVGDALKRSSPGSRVVAASFKDRAAVLLGGRRADAAFWFDNAAGGFVSSTYYMSQLPPWLVTWQRRSPAARFHGRLWTRLLPETGLYERLAGPDAQEGEWDGAGIVFPHPITGAPPDPDFYASLRRTPFADELLLDLALRMLDAYALGRRGATDMLLVGFSSADGVGHTYGPDSQETMDAVLRLDRVLQKLFEAVERASGGRALYALSADHGAMPLVEVLQRRGIEARRVKTQVIEDAVRSALDTRFPRAPALVARFDPPHFYLDLEAVRRQGLRRRDVEEAVAEGARSTGLVDAVYTAADFLGEGPPGDEAFALFRRSFFEPRSPHVILRLKPHVVLDDRGAGTSHGSPHDYDRHVPVVVMGPGVKAGRHRAPSGPEDLAPTLAALLGLEYPMQDAERLLTEAWGVPPAPPVSPPR